MAKNNKKNENEKPDYVARQSVWCTLQQYWWLMLLIIVGLGAFAFLQFIYLPNAEPDMAETLGLVASLSLATGIVCLIVLICDIIARPRFEFYDNRVVKKKGLFETKEQYGVFVGVYTVNVIQGFWGKIFNYGDVIVDYPGYWNLDTKRLAAPHRLRKYLQTRMTKTGLTAIISNTTPIGNLNI